MILLAALLLLQPGDFEALYRAAWEDRQRTLGATHRKTAESARDLGLYLVRQGRTNEARAPLEQALQVFERDGAAAEMGAILEALGRLDAAAQAFERSGDAAALLRLAGHLPHLYRRILALDAPPAIRAAALHNLAVTEEDHDPARAERGYREALELRRRHLAANDPELATTRVNLAALLVRQDRAAEAEPLARLALTAFETSLGASHPRVALAASTLAATLAARGAVHEAERLFRRALRIREATLAPQDPSLADECENLADLLAQTGRPAEAARLRARARAIRTGAR